MAASALHRLFSDHWNAWMRWDPIFATMCGDNRYNDRLPGADEAHYAGWLEQLEGFQSRLGQIEKGSLPPADRLNYEYFESMLSSEIGELGSRLYLLPISKASGFHTTFPALYLDTPLEKASDYENYLARLEALPTYFAGSIELMRSGLRQGYLPPRAVLQGVGEAIQAQILPDAEQSPFFEPFKHIPGSIPEAKRQRLIQQAKAAIQDSVLPAYETLGAFFSREYLPAARESIACADLPNGQAIYRQRIRYFTTLGLSPEQIHETGLSEVRRIRAEMETVMRKTGFAGGFQDFLHFLRSDPRFYVSTPDALLKETGYLLKRIDGELPRLFKTLPRLPYGIRPIPEIQAPGSTTAYYNPGSGDGTRAGFYCVNTYDLPSRPLYEMEALSLHEAVPGHHLQIALQQELSDLPEFRRFHGFTSYVEGWALYAERLGLEMGFYSDPYSDFGRLSYEMWRACRLVVDTGMHALGWTRQRAIDFMAENTSSTLLNIANEVDRYIAWPGQALAYKIGELKIRSLRENAELHLGTRFDVREFHDVLLLGGALPLDVLEARVETWLAEAQAARLPANA